MVNSDNKVLDKVISNYRIACLKLLSMKVKGAPSVQPPLKLYYDQLAHGIYLLEELFNQQKHEEAKNIFSNLKSMIENQQMQEENEPTPGPNNPFLHDNTDFGEMLSGIE